MLDEEVDADLIRLLLGDAGGGRSAAIFGLALGTAGTMVTFVELLVTGHAGEDGGGDAPPPAVGAGRLMPPPTTLM